MSPWLSVRFLQTQSDSRLVALSRDGHERAFEALVHRYRKPLLTHCRRLRMPATKAEDAVQQGLLQAWLAIQGGAEIQDVRPWLYRIVHNAALRMMDRSGQTQTQLSDSLPGAEGPHFDLDRRLSAREMLAGVAALPALQREALIRTAVNGQSHEHVAAELGLSHTAVRGLIYRARTTLRNAATALTPFPLIEWAAPAGRDANKLSQGLAELGAGGGAAGIGALLKGGAAVTAGIFVVGAAVVHPTAGVHEARAQDHVSARAFPFVHSGSASRSGATVDVAAVRVLPARLGSTWHRRPAASGGDGAGPSAVATGSGQSGVPAGSSRTGPRGVAPITTGSGSPPGSSAGGTPSSTGGNTTPPSTGASGSSPTTSSDNTSGSVIPTASGSTSDTTAAPSTSTSSDESGATSITASGSGATPDTNNSGVTATATPPSPIGSSTDPGE